MRRSWLNRFAWLIVAATLYLIFVGAMVTTKDAGLAVPDWPLSFGSLNPPGWWEVEEVFWEHSHRLTGAAIGLLTVVLAIWIWRTESRGWVRWMAFAAVVGVCLQGLLGGLRVTLVSTPLAIVHGCVAQAFLVLVLTLATVTSPRWPRVPEISVEPALGMLRWVAPAFAVSIYIQLILGATMRHFKAGLAIPDFPLAMGKLIPPIPNFAIGIHFAHRVGALVVLILCVWLCALAVRRFRSHRSLVAASCLSGFLVFLQLLLGGAVIWRMRPPVETTLHVLNGAVVLGTAVYIALHTLQIRSAGYMLAGEKQGPSEVIA